MLSWKQRRARKWLLRHLPEAFALAHALNAHLAIDSVGLLNAVQAAGFPDWASLDEAMNRHLARVVTEKARAENDARADLDATCKRALGLFGPRGTVLNSILAPISEAMPPREWHTRIYLNDAGCMVNAALWEAMKRR